MTMILSSLISKPLFVNSDINDQQQANAPVVKHFHVLDLLEEMHEIPQIILNLINLLLSEQLTQFHLFSPMVEDLQNSN